MTTVRYLSVAAEKNRASIVVNACTAMCVVRYVLLYDTLYTVDDVEACGECLYSCGISCLKNLYAGSVVYCPGIALLSEYLFNASTVLYCVLECNAFDVLAVRINEITGWDLKDVGAVLGDCVGYLYRALCHCLHTILNACRVLYRDKLRAALEVQAWLQ